MQHIFNLVKGRSIYFFSGAAMIILLLVCIIVNGTNIFFIPATFPHPFWLNVFLINFTFLGDAIFGTCLLIMLLFLKQRGIAKALFYSLVLSEIISQLINNLNNLNNPEFIIEKGQYYLPGANISPSVFVSGHTAIAFTIATIIILMSRNKRCQLPVLLTSVIVGYSRMYLAQQTLGEVIFGAMIGSLSALIGIYLAQQVKRPKFYFDKIGIVKTEPGRHSFN